ncbi:MAG: hypothetical protein LBM08_14655 [Dysgonamonadaceae bacterium]|jgi:hypothetical protein|nr:hypothetical protein [Dysgonamonadaceae bacterium]
MKMQVKSVLKSRIRFFGWVLLLVLPMMLATSCSKDDDDISSIMGTYKGTLYCLENDIFVPLGIIPSDLFIESGGGNNAVVKTTIDLMSTITDFSLEVNCPVSITTGNGVYTVAGETKVSIPNIPVSVPVSVSGTIQTGLLKKAVILITPEALGFDLSSFKYEGVLSPL